jgi:hypothetical protein
MCVEGEMGAEECLDHEAKCDVCTGESAEPRSDRPILSEDMTNIMDDTLEVLDEGDRDPWAGEERPASVLLQAKDQESEQRWVVTLGRAQALAERCAYCYVVSDGLECPNHTVSKCPQINWGTFSTFKHQIHFQEFSACFVCGFPQEVCMTGVSGCTKCRHATGQKCDDKEDCPGPCKFNKMLLVACYAALRVHPVGGISDHLEAGCRHAVKVGGHIGGASLGRSATIGRHNVSVLFTIFEKLLDTFEWA